MENQHRKISGYRDLSQVEIDLMNRIKELGGQVHGLVGEVEAHLLAQANAEFENQMDKLAEGQRLMLAEPRRWLSIARTDLQQGLMALTRSVAQPGGF